METAFWLIFWGKRSRIKVELILSFAGNINNLNIHYYRKYMIFEHENFSLNTETRKVFDVNNKELCITGNSYRLLVFLCQKKSATISDIGQFLDTAKDYNENHVRQYRYKINIIIGKPVIEYKNNVYSLSGEIQEFDEKRDNFRNTDLLHSDDVKSDIDNKKENMKNISILPGVFSIILLLLSFYDWSFYGYYTFLKIVVTATAVYYAYFIYIKLKKTDFWFWTNISIAILFNPIIPVYLRDKGLWLLIDVLVVGYLVVLMKVLRKSK